MGTGTTAALGKPETIYDPADAALAENQRTILLSYMIDSQLVTVNYTGYLYDSTKADGKGAVVETSAPGESMFPEFPMQPFTLGAGKPLAGSTALIGFDQAVVGMKVGGKRTAVFPATLAYGPTAIPARTAKNNLQKTFPAVPANSPLVYDIELVAVTMLPNIRPVPPPTVLTDLVTPTVGAGKLASAGKFAQVRYTVYFYDGTRDSRIGTQIQTNVTTDTTVKPFSFEVNTPAAIAAMIAAKQTPPVIEGFNNAIFGMQVGGKRTVIIPGKMAYGALGNAGIPPNTSLVYSLELVDVLDTAPAP